MVLVIVIALLLLVPAGSGAQTEPARLSDVTVTPQADSSRVVTSERRASEPVTT